MDCVLRGAQLVDGTRAPARRADVAVLDGRIQAIDGSGGRDLPDVDLTGLVLAPGFIDPHTHYDAQIFWDPELTPSSWHGVTTAVMGNCGFSVAPTRAEHREQMLRTLERVEGMPLDALREGLPWGFESYPEYLDAIERMPKRINVASLIGHTALRHYVVGPDAAERAATPAEIEDMRAVLGEALTAGAVGFSTSKSPTHTGAHNRPVASRAATLEEITSLADVLGEQEAGLLQATWGPELYLEEFATIAKRTGRPVTWAAIMADRSAPGRATGIAGRTADLGGEVYPQIACRPIVMQIVLSDPTPFARMPSFKQAIDLASEERAALYACADWRRHAELELEAEPLWAGRLAEATVEETTVHTDLVNGSTLGELARARDTTPFEVMIQLALADGLATRFRVLLTNDDDEQVAQLLQDDRLLLGLSDAGAHTSQLCDANAPTYLLGHWWRETRTISLEDAVWRLTGHPAAVFGLRDRGVITPGAVADLVAFDPETVGTQPLERVYDLPAGSDRLVAHSIGIEHMWVGGQHIRSGGRDETGAYPGRLLRHGVS